MTQTRKNYLALFIPIIITLCGVISSYAVVSYRVSEQAAQIKELKDESVPRTEYQELINRLNRMENKIDKVDDHIQQHIEASIPVRRSR